MVYSSRFVLCLALCCFVLVFFNSFSIAITSLGEERASLGAFRTLFDLRLFFFVFLFVCFFFFFLFFFCLFFLWLFFCFLFLLVSEKSCGL